MVLTTVIGALNARVHLQPLEQQASTRQRGGARRPLPQYYRPLCEATRVLRLLNVSLGSILGHVHCADQPHQCLSLTLLHSLGSTRCLRSRLFASPPKELPSGRLGDAQRCATAPQPSNSAPLVFSRVLVLILPF